MEQGLVRMLPLTRAWMAGQSRRGSRRLEFLPQRLFPAPASPPPRNPMPRRCQPHKHRDLPLMGVQKAMALGHACVHPDLGVRTSRPKETWQGSPHTSSWKHFWYHHSRAPQPALRHSTKQPKTLWKHRNPRCCWYLYPDRWDLWATNAAMEHCLRSCCRVQLPLRPVVHLYCPWLVESLLQELPNCLRRIRLPSGTVAAPNCLYPRQHRPAWMMLASHNPLRLLSCLLRLPPSNRQCPRQHHLTWALTPAPPNPHCQRPTTPWHWRAIQDRRLRVGKTSATGNAMNTLTTNHVPAERLNGIACGGSGGHNSTYHSSNCCCCCWCRCNL
mmetsp:Transcript_135566/g.343036  ORF Transcript_135566/g.343036 Transcript_135566/m.343036 type:complete len:329 (-) Transcript_135566:1212-2198(-)